MPAHLAVASAPAFATPRDPCATPSSDAFDHTTSAVPHATRATPPSVGRTARPDYLPIDDLCGADARMQDLLARGKRFIDRGLPVLILGETGTGKEYLARALHDYSERRANAFVAINTASIPEHLVESELFGYQRGAFSGALPGGMKGKLQQADGGTLFLDEIGDMPLTLQTRLLRVLSEREVTPLGASRAVPVDVQLICATHQNLSTLVAQGGFREDLYYRIAVGVLSLPALRERDDKPALIARMLCDEWPTLTPQAALRGVSSDAMARLVTHAWPGNLRQMRAALRYACAVMSGPEMHVSDLPVELQEDVGVRRRSAWVLHETGRPMRADASQITHETDKPRMRDRHVTNDRHDAHASPDGTTHRSLDASPVPAATFSSSSRDAGSASFERERILQALAQHRWNISAAARSLGFCRASLYRKLKQLHIPHVRDCASELIGTQMA